jgi:NADH-quinone oxidoreductase subunit F
MPWLYRLLSRIEAGEGSERDLETLESLCDSIGGKTLCPFGDAAIAPAMSTLAKFREEYEYHVREHQCWRKVAKTFEEAKARAGRGSAA